MIDARAIIDPSARLGEDVSVGPWTIIGPDVEIGDGCVIDAHVVVRGPTTLGARNRIYQFATVGEDTPALAYGGEPTRLIVGDDNVIREGVTIHRGMVQDRGETRIGSHNLLMAYVHVGHDCVVGDHCVFANNASISGHCHVGDWANLGGYCGVPQFRSVGAHAMVGGMSLVTKDVPAFVTVSGNPAAAIGPNVEGLRRRGFSKDAIRDLRRAYRTLYRSGLRAAEAVEAIAAMDDPEGHLAVFADSVRAARHGVVRPRGGAGAADDGD
jgi:UDP-N-acetylglucosamine acyltransferase